MVELPLPKFDIKISEQPKGLMISQHGRDYLAKKWTLSRQVYGLIREAIKGGFTSLWTEHNPTSSKKCVDYICFSRSHEDPWEFKFNKDGCKRALGESLAERITVNKKYKNILKANGVEPEIERKIGESLEWRESPGKKTSRILLHQNRLTLDQADWSDQQLWLAEKLELFKEVFGQLIKPPKP